MDFASESPGGIGNIHGLFHPLRVGWNFSVVLNTSVVTHVTYTKVSAMQLQSPVAQRCCREGLRKVCVLRMWDHTALSFSHPDGDQEKGGPLYSAGHRSNWHSAFSVFMTQVPLARDWSQPQV